MSSPPTGFSVSSGRRPPPVRSGCLVAAGVLVIIAALVVLETTRHEETPPVIVVASTPVAPAPPPATPSATPTELVELESEWVVVSTTVTPTPWIRAATVVPRRREPTPTPSARDCILASYDAHQSLAAWGNVLVNVRATNRCRRVLQPTDVLFRVTGYRDGAVVQTAQGSPFQEIWPGRSTDFSIGLPGSIDWYDEIRVDVLD